MPETGTRDVVNSVRELGLVKEQKVVADLELTGPATLLLQQSENREDRESRNEEDKDEASRSDWKQPMAASPEVLAAIGQSRTESDRKAQRFETRIKPEAGLPPVGIALMASAAPSPGWRRPLLWCNRLFDWCTGWLGPPGRWLRGTEGRSLLGWVGLGLLAGVLAWVLVNELGLEW
jgi:hypothetical protein